MIPVPEPVLEQWRHGAPEGVWFHASHMGWHDAERTWVHVGTLPQALSRAEEHELETPSLRPLRRIYAVALAPTGDVVRLSDTDANTLTRLRSPRPGEAVLYPNAYEGEGFSVAASRDALVPVVVEWSPRSADALRMSDAIDNLRDKVELGRVIVPPHVKVKNGKTIRVKGYTYSTSRVGVHKTKSSVSDQKGGAWENTNKHVPKAGIHKPKMDDFKPEKPNPFAKPKSQRANVGRPGHASALRAGKGRSAVSTEGIAADKWRYKEGVSDYGSRTLKDVGGITIDGQQMDVVQVDGEMRGGGRKLVIRRNDQRYFPATFFEKDGKFNATDSAEKHDSLEDAVRSLIPARSAQTPEKPKPRRKLNGPGGPTQGQLPGIRPSRPGNIEPQLYAAQRHLNRLLDEADDGTADDPPPLAEALQALKEALPSGGRPDPADGAEVLAAIRRVADLQGKTPAEVAKSLSLGQLYAYYVGMVQASRRLSATDALFVKLHGGAHR